MLLLEVGEGAGLRGGLLEPRPRPLPRLGVAALGTSEGYCRHKTAMYQYKDHLSKHVNLVSRLYIAGYLGAGAPPWLPGREPTILPVLGSIRNLGVYGTEYLVQCTEQGPLFSSKIAKPLEGLGDIY